MTPGIFICGVGCCCERLANDLLCAAEIQGAEDGALTLLRCRDYA